MPLQSEQEDEPAPGVRRWLISCDETGVHGARFYGFGSLWMSWQRRGQFNALINDLRARHAHDSEIKWNKVRPRNAEFYTDLIEEFFRAPWMQFHCLLVEKAIVRRELHNGDYDLARRKHFTLLLTNKIRRALRAHHDRSQTFRVWVDPIHSRYSKADEVVELISNSVLSAVSGRGDCVDGVFPHDSHSTPSIQISDLLLGAVWSAFEQSAESEAKLDLRTWIAWHLGWEDLAADTAPDARKFNVWVFYDKSRGGRRTQMRQVRLRYPLPGGRM
jgi:hypothetical protein